MIKQNRPGIRGGGGAQVVKTGVVDTNPIYGSDPTGAGVRGESNTGPGVVGKSIRTLNPSTIPGSGQSDGVQGESIKNGVHGISHSATDSGVVGENLGGGFGVSGQTTSNSLVLAGVFGVNYGTGTGVVGESTAGGCGVCGMTTSKEATNAGVLGVNSGVGAGVAARNQSAWNGDVPSGFALWASSNATGVYSEGNPAAYFKGDVQVTGDLILINSTSGDIAEDFDVEDEQINLDPGTVLVINQEGRLCACSIPYDTRVAGVISGAGELRPAVVLQRVSSPIPRSPIALLGKAFCKVDATPGSIAAGDLLTTSERRGYAMKASDKSRALGAIIGKALAPLNDGFGVIPMMVTLR